MVGRAPASLVPQEPLEPQEPRGTRYSSIPELYFPEVTGLGAPVQGLLGSSVQDPGRPRTPLPGSGALGGSCAGQDWAGGGGCRSGGPSWGCPRPWCGGGSSAGAPGGCRWWREA